MSTVSPSTVAPVLTPAGGFRLARAVRRSLRVTATLTIWVGFGVLTGVAIAIAAPKFFGGQALTVMSGSMEPAIHTGDIVLTERIAPLDAKVGDVITFRSPERESHLLTHRAREIRVEGDRVHFVTKGDAVNGVERWNVPMDATLARPKLRLWKLGYPLFWLNLPFGRLLLYLLPVLVVGGYALLSIWRSASTETEAEADRPLPDSNYAGPDDVASDHARADEAASEPAAKMRVLHREPVPEATSPRVTEVVLLPALGIAAYAVFRVFRPRRRRFR